MNKQKIVLYLAKSYYHMIKDGNEFQENRKFIEEKINQLIDEKEIDRGKVPHDNATGNTALHYLAASNEPFRAVIEKLCLLTYVPSESKTDENEFVSAENKSGNTPVILAIQNNSSPQIIGLLINKQNYSEKQLAKIIHYLIKHNQHGFATRLLKNAKIAELTCSRQWEPDTGNNALHMLMLDANPNLELISIFLTVPSSTRLNKNNETPLLIAARMNSLDVIQLASVDPNIIKLYDQEQLKNIILQLIANKQFQIVHNFLKNQTVDIPSFEWTPIYIKLMENEIKLREEQKLEPKENKITNEFKSEDILPHFQLEPKRTGFQVVAITSLESKAQDSSENMEFQVFKLLCQNIFFEKNIDLTKQTKDQENILTLAMKSHQDDIAIFVINHFNLLFEQYQYNKMFESFEEDNKKYHFSPRVVYSLLEKASYKLSYNMMKICISIYIENVRNQDKAPVPVLPHPKFLDHLPGDAEQKRMDAQCYIKFMLKSAKTTHEIMNFIIDFAHLQKTMRFFYPADDKPRKEILNYARKKLLNIMEKDPSQLDNIQACQLIMSSSRTDNSYANKLKKLQRKQLIQSTIDINDLTTVIHSLNL